MAVERWLSDRVDEFGPPLRATAFANGRSNLTYRLQDRHGNNWVLRRPPLGHTAPTAHDIGREFRIMAALAGTAVPVPRTVGLAEAGELLDVPISIVDYVDGVVLGSEPDLDGLPEAARPTVSTALIDGLVDVHAVNPHDVGLGELGRSDGYLQRQLRRWHQQWKSTMDRDVDGMAESHLWLRENAPPQAETTLVHGDYRLDNCIFDRVGRLKAVLDWELCTLGDPLVDLGLLLAYWHDDGNRGRLFQAPTWAPGFSDRAALLARYAEVSGRDIATIDYYLVFAFWKLACILQGVDRRYRHGQMGARPAVGDLRARVERLAGAARAAIPG